MSAVGALAKRELVRFYRQRGRLIGSLASPLLFWIFLGTGLGAAFPAPRMPGGGGFLEYFFPGICLLTVLFTSIFSNISLIEDRHEGFLQAVLVAPVSRLSMVAGKIFGGSLLALLQGLLFLALAPLAGFSLSSGQVAMAIAALAAVAFTLTALGFLFAWWLDSVQSFHSIMNVVLMPMWLLSGAFFSAATAPKWLQPVMYLNPLTYGYSALRQALYTPATRGLSFGVCLGVTVLCGAIFYSLAVLAVLRPPKEAQ